MIALTAGTKNFMATELADMRKGFDGLCGLVTSVLKQGQKTGQEQ